MQLDRVLRQVIIFVTRGCEVEKYISSYLMLFFILLHSNFVYFKVDIELKGANFKTKQASLWLIIK